MSELNLITKWDRKMISEIKKYTSDSTNLDVSLDEKTQKLNIHGSNGSIEINLKNNVNYDKLNEDQELELSYMIYYKTTVVVIHKDSFDIYM